MSKNDPKNNIENGVVIAAGPGANPSSFPKFDTPVDPLAGVPDEERRGDPQPDDYDGFPGRRGGGDYIDLPGGGHVAPNGAVIHDPSSDVPELKPDHEYTPEKEDLNLLIM